MPNRDFKVSPQPHGVGFFAPVKTDAKIVATLNNAINAIVQTPEVKKKLDDMKRFDPIVGSPEQADAMFHADVARSGERWWRPLDLSIK